MSDRNVVLVADDRSTSFMRLAAVINAIDPQVSVRAAPLESVVDALRDHADVLDLNSQLVKWSSIRLVLTDTSDPEATRINPLRMPHAGIEIAVRISIDPLSNWNTEDPGDAADQHLPIVGYSFDAGTVERRIAWRVVDRPFVDLTTLLNRTNLEGLLDPNPHEAFRFAENMNDPSLPELRDEDWEALGMTNPDRVDWDPAGAIEAIWLALTEPRRRHNGYLWKMLATNDPGTNAQAAKASRVWAEENLGPLLGPANDGHWTFRTIKVAIRAICGYPIG